ncbi:MAG: D-alanyl-D-alanine carboxypeptidase family protein [Blautia wexlerae]
MKNKDILRKKQKKSREICCNSRIQANTTQGLSVDINADTDKCSSEKVYQWLDENAYKYGFVKRYPEDKTDITRN